MGKSIMIQGTMSNAGKSLICAALCRIFRQDGYSVAPFKSQNMALNSFITKEGLEMGRAQVVQAEAAGVEPSAAMNPILLKPVTNMGSQVIVMGEACGNMDASTYYQKKNLLRPVVEKAYQSLADRYDIVVIEGAGSPAEINLRDNDFVNMGMAAIAEAPVLLVGDIDRGGVFAQLYGTIALLEPDEQKRIKAMIINKFRGDESLLKDGLRMLEEKTQKPVAGVIPMMNVDIDDEDSLSERLRHKTQNAILDLAVIRLPRMSNFTDFTALEAVEGVAIRYVDRPSELGQPDLVILPGTKSTISDLLWLRTTGLEASVKKLVAAGCVVIGICGGYQMLGERITDPEGVETSVPGSSVRGMELLPTETVFEEEKHRTRVTGTVPDAGGALCSLKGVQVEGYEIHMGRTDRKAGAAPLICLQNGTYDGCQKGSVYGTYLHGFFDSAPCREAVLNSLARAKGALLTDQFDYAAYRKKQYDILADGVRSHLDMKLIYEILGESKG